MFVKHFRGVLHATGMCFVAKTQYFEHDVTSKMTTQTVIFSNLTRFGLAMLGFIMVSWKDPRQQSTKVEKSKVEGLSFIKLQKLKSHNYLIFDLTNLTKLTKSRNLFLE